MPQEIKVFLLDIIVAIARVAKHEKNVLDLFKKEVKSMNDLANEKDIFNVVKTDEVEALKEDVDYINSKINK